MRKTEKGFTVLELMVVLVIAVISMTIAVPSLTSILSNNKISGAADKLKADMSWARTTAIRDNKDIEMVFSATGDGSWCYGFDDDLASANCDCTLKTTAAGACTVDSINRRNDQSTYGTTTLNEAFAGTDLTFNSRGLSDKTGDFTLSIDSKDATISVNALGRANICSDDLVSIPNC